MHSNCSNFVQVQSLSIVTFHYFTIKYILLYIYRSRTWHNLFIKQTNCNSYIRWLELKPILNVSRSVKSKNVRVIQLSWYHEEKKLTIHLNRVDIFLLMVLVTHVEICWYINTLQCAFIYQYRQRLTGFLQSKILIADLGIAPLTVCQLVSLVTAVSPSGKHFCFHA